MKISSVAGICLLTLILIQYAEDARARAIEDRIISGQNAVPGQLPWQVILKKDEWDSIHCGGSIITDNWVLTAAHCTYGLPSLILVFGTIHLDDPNALNMTATQFFVHSKYNAANLNNDVSLIKLPRSLPISSSNQFIRPIRLTSSTTNSYLGSAAIIAGFGLIDDDDLEYSETLLYGPVQIIDNAQCVSVFGADVVLPSTMCARGANGSNVSTCSGDSGGPLITWDNYSLSYIQIGINSFVALDQCTMGFPSGFARVSSFLTFIQNTITQNN